MARRIFLHLYLMRVPVFLLLAMGWFLPNALASPFLRGLADLQTGQVSVVAFAAFLLLSAALSSSFLVLLYGSQRADGKREPLPPGARTAEMPQRLPLSKWIVGILYFGSTALFLRFLWQLEKSMQAANLPPADLASSFWWQAACGTLLAALLVVALFLLDLYLSDPRSAPEIEVFALPLVYLFHEAHWLSALLGALNRQHPLEALRMDFLLRRSNRPSLWLARILGPGYGSFDANGNPVEIYPGHRFAGALAVFCFSVYLYVGHGFYSVLNDNAVFPTQVRSIDAVLLQVILLLLLACWTLAALCFFFDRFRVPVLIPIVLFVSITSQLGFSDHVFHAIQRPALPVALPTPADLLAAKGDRVIVVAAAGGGIQAAAWTSQVLCGLRADTDTFADEVLAISGVSGGSVGTMFYLRCVESGPKDAQGATLARNSSLESIAWGLAHPDLRRAVLPFDWASWHGADRGWALERALRKNAQFSPLDQNRPLDLDRPLASSGLQGKWPTVLFNSTEVRTGDPMVFTNSDFPPPLDAPEKNHALHGFHKEYPGNDVNLESAVRMSSAFPYVSPDARLDAKCNAEHLADGGYFDNSGLYTLTQWLKAALSAPSSSGSVQPPTRQRILILILDAFPEAQWNGPADKPKTWPYQLIAPLITVLGVRSEGALVRDRTDVSSLLEILNLRNYQAAAVTVRYVPANRTYEPAKIDCPQKPPLTWRLTPLEKACIDQEWQALEPALKGRIEKFFAAARPAAPKAPPKLLTTMIQKGLYWQEMQ